jgi:hypothetical protein
VRRGLPNQWRTLLGDAYAPWVPGFPVRSETASGLVFAHISASLESNVMLS